MRVDRLLRFEKAIHVRSEASEPEKVAALIQIISENLGYALYRAVEETKLELTAEELATFRFSYSMVPIAGQIERWRFESWIQDDIQTIAASRSGSFK